jgi:integrase
MRLKGCGGRQIGNDLGIYGLRRGFLACMEDAGIWRSRGKLYAGHSAGDVTDLYERRELDAWLRREAERLATHAGVAVRGAAKSDPGVQDPRHLPRHGFGTE